MKKNKEQKPMLVMIPGKLYRLRNIKKNRTNKYMAISKYGQTLRLCKKIGHPFGARRYTDGDVFLCLGLGSSGPQPGPRDYIIYSVLTPEGVIASLYAYRNKSKFVEVI